MTFWKRLSKIFIYLCFASILLPCSNISNNAISNDSKDNLFLNNKKENEQSTADSSSSEEKSFGLETIDLNTNGDSTLIHYGDKQILIDAGGNSDSGANIIKQLDKYCSDGVIDYVIFSHGDRDHIVNFSKDTSSSSVEKWLNEKEERRIDYLIDFDVWQDKSCNYSKTNYCKSKDTDDDDESDETVTTYEKYCDARKRLIDNGKIKHYFAASEVLFPYRNLSKDDLKKANKQKNYADLPDDCTFSIDSSKNFSLKILNNQFCYKPIEWEEGHEPSSVDRNILSVCALVTFGEEKYKFLFTGDLPEFQGSSYVRSHAGGETALVKNNYEDLKDNVIFFKAAHHGSPTSNTDALLSLIRPQYISVSCVIDGQYNFPAQDVLNRMCLYTDKIYFTDIKDAKNDTAIPFNGTISYKYNDGENEDGPDKIESPLLVSFSNAKMPQSALETSVFSLTNGARNFPLTVNELTNGSSVYVNNSSYFKIGSTDILINDGGPSLKDMQIINSQIDSLCNDRVLDCLIISAQNSYCYNYLNYSNGLFSKKYHIKKVKNLIVHPHTNGDDFDKALLEFVAKGIEDKFIENVYGVTKNENSRSSKLTDKYSFSDVDIFGNGNSADLKVGEAKVSILASKYNVSAGDTGKNFYQNSLPIVITAGNFNYLNLGICYDPSINSEVLKNATSFSKKINAMTIPGYGYYLNEEENLDQNSSNSITRYYSSVISRGNTAFLFNCPFGTLSNGMNLYPSVYWKYNQELVSCTSQTNSGSSDTGIYVAATKAVGSENRYMIDENNTNGSIALVGYTNSTRMSIWKYNEINGQNSSFSFYDETRLKRSDYTKATAKTVKDSSLGDLLSKKK